MNRNIISQEHPARRRDVACNVSTCNVSTCNVSTCNVSTTENKLKNIFIILAATFLIIACSKNTPPDNQEFERLLNLPYPALMDSLHNIQSELDRLYRNEHFSQSVYHYYYDYYNNLIDFAEKKGDRRLVAAATFKRALIDESTFKNYEEFIDY
ncbi:MAG: hypothetical protein LBD59_01095, partial [Prevotellaceae bacterium]|nr:hypothetical protein [Prevotellaceae bacterium]